MKRTLIPAFAYLRVSGKGQIEGDGFTRQLLAINEYAKQHGYLIAKVFRELGVSGANELEDRPALLDLFSELETNGDGVKTVICENLSRWARDLFVQESILRDIKKNGCTLISVAEPDLCDNDPSRKLVRQLFGAIHEYEKSMVVLKLRGARQRMKQRTGRCEGRKPYGSYPGEAETLARMTALRSEGASYQRIADTLTSEGRLSRSGGQWHPDVINSVLRAQRLQSMREGTAA